MEKSKKLCLISHCFLNANSKIEGPCKYEATLKELIYALIENNMGVIQLPCPETTYLGINRWGHVREQFDNPYFREHCKKILTPIVMQIEDYTKSGYEIRYIVGVNGSPSCGVEVSCSASQWKGEISKIESIQQLKDQLEYAPRPGVFMEIFMDMLKEKSIEIEFIGINEGRVLEYDFLTMFK